MALIRTEDVIERLDTLMKAKPAAGQLAQVRLNNR